MLIARAHRPGRRRRADEPGDAVDHLRHVPAASSAARRSGSGPASRRSRSRSARSSAACSPSTSAGTGSSSSTSRSASSAIAAQLPADRRVEGQTHEQRSTCPACSPRRSGSSRSPTALIEANAYGWTLGADRRLFVGRGRLAGLVRRCSSGASALPDARPDALPERHLHRRERRRCCSSALGDVRRLLLRLALHAERPRLLGRPGRRRVPADDGADHPDRADRREGRPTASARAG